MKFDWVYEILWVCPTLVNFQLKLSRGGSPWSNGPGSGLSEAKPRPGAEPRERTSVRDRRRRPHDIERISLCGHVPESGTVRDPLVSLSEDRGGWVHNRARPITFVQEVALLSAY